MRGAGLDLDCVLRISCSLGLQPSRRELTPVRLCSVRLSWRQRARPSTTLHEIQICRSRLEYFVCTTACGGPQLERCGGAEVVSTGWGGVGVLDRCRSRNPVRERTSNEEIFEVCCKFLDECVPGDWVDGYGADHADPKAKKKSGSSRAALRLRRRTTPARPEWNDYDPAASDTTSLRRQCRTGGTTTRRRR